ncbi:MAG: amino acid adenylation domain-containing protein [Candidatus Aminicenantes bacterium]|jgi:amino acid adenylation domain-containing protein
MSGKNIDKSEELTIVARQLFKEREYWSKKLSGELPKTSFPRYFNRTGTETHIERRMETQEFQLPPDIASKLLKLSNKSDRRLYMILISGVFVLLNKYTGNRHIIVGMPVEKQEIEGDFINTVLTVRTHWQENTSLKELLLKTRKIILEAMENQNYPVEMLLYDLGMEPDEKEFPLFDLAALLENIHEKKFLTPLGLNMIFVFNRRDERIAGSVEYNSLFYEKMYVNRIIGHFISLLKKVLTNIDEPLDEICILSGEEKNQLLYTFNNTPPVNAVDSGAQGKTIQGLFEAAAEKNGHRIALIHENTQLSYQQLDENANRFAHVLRAKGVQTDILVGLMVQRSLEMIIGMLGILKAGGAYLPLDPGYPMKRLEYMINDSGVTLLATSTNHAENVDFKGEWLRIDIHRTDHMEKNANKLGVYNSRGCAYVIYTSGSTGRPKGVVVEHRSIVNTLYWRKNYYDFNQKDTILQVPAFSFDSSVEDIFTPLMGDSKLLLLKRENPYEIQDISKLIMKFLVTHFLIIPNFYKILIRQIADSLKHVKIITVAGESFTEELVKAHFDKLKTVRLYNEYGPTENSVCTTVYEFTPHQTQVLIGKPINNVYCYILDNRRELVPIGVPGQLSLSGEGLARGYLNNPELTFERFKRAVNSHSSLVSTSPSKLSPNDRSSHSPIPPFPHFPIYLTGDLVRWLFEGNIQFLGRIDRQVKIRGYRIELGEIESRLLKNKGIKAAVVSMPEDQAGDKYLCSYIVAENENVMSGLRESLSKELPAYMVPTYFVQLDKIPLTPNGKVDQDALPAPGIQEKKDYAPPQDNIERKLQDIWSGVLGIEKEKIGIHDHFFHLGGHSLRATILVSRIYKELDVNVPLTQIFITPDIRGLAAFVKHAEKQKFSPIQSVEKKEYYILSSAQRRLFVLQQMDKQGIGYNMPSLWHLNGHLELEKFKAVFHRLTQRNESFKTFFMVVKDEPVQGVSDFNDLAFEIEYHDICKETTGGTAREQEKVETAVRTFIRPFDLTMPPLLRVGLIKEDNQNHLLMIDMHHIIADGTSIDLFVNEFITSYAGKELFPLKFQYKDYAQWQNNEIQQEALKEQEKYWLNQFADEIPVLQLPLDFPRPQVQCVEGDLVNFQLDIHETKALNDLAAKENITLYMLMLAIFNVLLAKLSGQEDIIMGTDVAGRRHADFEHIIGMFVNALVLRNYPREDQSFKKFLQDVKTRTLAALENQDYQFDDLVYRLVKDRDESRNPIFDVMFSFQELDLEVFEITDNENCRLKATPRDLKNRIAKFDLTLTILQSTGQLYLSFEYRTKLFTEATIKRFSSYFKEITKSILEKPDVKIEEIEMVSDKEENQFLNAVHPEEDETVVKNEIQPHNRPGTSGAEFDF